MNIKPTQKSNKTDILNGDQNNTEGLTIQEQSTSSTKAGLKKK